MEIELNERTKIKTDAFCLTLMRRHIKKDRKTGDHLGYGWTETYYSSLKTLLDAMVEFDLRDMDKIQDLWNTEVRLKKLIKSLPDRLIESDNRAREANAKVHASPTTKVQTDSVGGGKV